MTDVTEAELPLRERLALRAVRRGLRWMESTIPGIAKQLDTEILDTGSGTHCPLGQAYLLMNGLSVPDIGVVSDPHDKWYALGLNEMTAYEKMCEVYDITQEQARWRGFFLPSRWLTGRLGLSYKAGDFYKVLNRTWERVLSEHAA